MDNLPKIECKTEEIIKSKKTGKTYNTMEEFLKENPIEDLQKDLSITVSNKGLELLQKVMNQK
jgi:ASC-1-like (ASCH) protein